MDSAEQPARRKKRARVVRSGLQIATTIALLGWALTRVDGSLLSRAKLQPSWLALALACTLPAYAAAALRWSFTASRLGVALPFKRALPEVYLGSLLNCLLPSGFAGDLLRIARHGSALGEDRVSYQRALLSVALERLSGQALLWLVLLASLTRWPLLARFVPWAVLAVPLLLGIGLLLRRRRASAPAGSPAHATKRDTLHAVRRAVLADGALAVQLATSSLVLTACTLGFACCARGLSVPLSLSELVRIVPPLLAVSALPLSIGGFGLREAASAVLYTSSGLDAATGIAVASTYGLTNLIGSTPGALCLRRNARRNA